MSDNLCDGCKHLDKKCAEKPCSTCLQFIDGYLQVMNYELNENFGGYMISEFDYFFYEWLILSKNLDDEKFKQLTDEEFQELKNEFVEFSNKLT